MSRRKYHWTPELLARLREVYYAGSRAELGRGLDAMQRDTTWPRVILTEAARLRGWSLYCCRPWSQDELAYLSEHAGSMPVGRIARQLRRSKQSVMSMAGRIGRPSRLTEGYTVHDLAECMGVHHRLVENWARRGLLGRPARSGELARYRTESVARFLRQNAVEYDLRRVDQLWFKGMVFG